MVLRTVAGKWVQPSITRNGERPDSYRGERLTENRRMYQQRVQRRKDRYCS